MDSKTLSVLEYPKIRERLVGFCDFSASTELARALEPTDSYDLALARLAETSEARKLFSTNDNVGVGGAHDIRPSVELAARGGVLDPQQLLDIKSTLISSRELKKSLERKTDEFPRLSQITAGLPESHGMVDAITRVLSDRGEVLDSASPKLATLRREIKIAHDRLMSRLQRYLTESANKLQEPIITQRDGRYVIPLRAEFKGQIKAVVHDQSSSGATLFVEPLPIVDLNNAMRELQLQERDEERRILYELSAQIAEHREELIYGLENLAMLDLIFAKAKYAEELKASEPVLGQRSKVKGAAQSASKGQKSEDLQPSTLHLPALKLIYARHPLLDPNTVVPIDVDPQPGTRAIVITGPNTGGKTVSLKTVGLFALMAQSGLHIPAQSGSEIPFFHAVYADIGDEQSIEQSLSTFSGHITNIIRILKHIDVNSLVIFDELGAGTDPQEGAALARAILKFLLESGCTTLVATHYPELKTFAHSTEGVVNASLEFDIKTLRPTYHLTIGLPGRSNALLIAQRLGLPQPIIDSAKAEINPEDLRADKLLDDIRKERNRTSRERQKLEKARDRLEAQTKEIEKRLEKIEDERREVLAKARAEGELEVAILKRNIDSLKSQLKKAKQPLDAIKSIEEKIEQIEEKVEAPVERRSTIDRGPSSIALRGRPWSLGERVTVSTLNAEGVVTALGESDAEVQVGSLRIRARLSELQRKGQLEENAEEKKQEIRKPEVEGSGRASLSGTKSPGLELNLRGKLVEEGLEELERYLERAFSAGLLFVRIVHGKGTGRMREAVRNALKDSPYVASFEEPKDNEGGAGVTVAKMAR
jgi:DNA mismatch repair protein MutS2